jgi:Putative lumazine-binding
MIRRITILLALSLALAATAALAHDTEDAAPDAAADAAIKDVVDRGYVHGVHIDADGAKIRSGMHESFVMFVRGNDGAVSTLTRDAWIERIEAGKAKAKPDAPKPEIKAEIDVIDRTADTAIARVKLRRDGKHIFTDYISLYRFDSGWKMVGKVFQRH